MDATLIRIALVMYAKQRRGEARGRKLSGAQYAEGRARIRDEAAQADELADRLIAAEALYTREEVSQAMNAGADMVTHDLLSSPENASLVDLVVNAGLTLLDNPGVSLNDVIEENYQAEDPDEDPIAMVRGWITGT